MERPRPWRRSSSTGDRSLAGRAPAGAARADIHLAAEISGSPFTGPAATEASALALVSIAWGESSFRPDVASCRIVGSDLPSVSAYQLVGHFALDGARPAEVCDSEALAAYLALGVLRRHAARCRLCTHQQLFHAYASGNPRT